MKRFAVIAALAALCAGGAYAATVVTELHSYSQTYTEQVTVGSKGKQQVITIVGTVSGTITDQDTYPDPVTVTQTVTVGGTTSTQVTTTQPTTTGHPTPTTTTAPTTTTEPPSPPPPTDNCTVVAQPSADSNYLNSVYQGVSPGATICLATGNFGYQLVKRDPDKAIGSARVTIRPLAGNMPMFTKLSLGYEQINAFPPNDLTIRDFYAGYPLVWGSRNVSLLNLSGRGFDVFRYNGNPGSELVGEAQGADVLVQGGDYGPCEAPRQDGCTVRIIGTRIVVDGVTIHDVTSTDPINFHTDGMFVRGCIDCKVLRSKWYGNEVTNIRIQNCCQLPAIRNLEIADNWFACPTTGAAQGSVCRWDGIDVDGDVPGLRIHHNSFASGTGVLWAVTGDGCCNYIPQTDAEESRNIEATWPDYSPCATGVRVIENARTPRGAYRLCGSDVFVGDPMYVNPSNEADMDYRLLPGSPAIGYGSRLSESP
jgi:hypothetical protein